MPWAKRHLLTGLFRQAVFGRLAGYEDVNDADRLAHDPAMRAVVDRQGLDRQAASTSQMGRFETGWLTSEANLAALADLSGAWIDRVYAHNDGSMCPLDLDDHTFAGPISSTRLFASRLAILRVQSASRDALARINMTEPPRLLGGTRTCLRASRTLSNDAVQEDLPADYGI